MMVEVDDIDGQRLFLTVDRIDVVGCDGCRLIDDEYGVVITMASGRKFELNQSIDSFKRLLQSQGVQILRG